MSKEIKARIAGYAWALSQERASEYNDLVSFNDFAEAFPMPQGDEQAALFAEWEQGVWDARIMTRDDSFMSVAEAAEIAGVSERYIRDEIERGNLKIFRDKPYILHPDDFRNWYASPLRGKNSKKAKVE